MNHQRQHMLAISAFASAAHLSIKALRLYEQLDILKPSYVDPETGYRYYHSDQLDRARRIRGMREMDMPLATIRRVLMAPPAQAEGLVRAYWQQREARMEQARQAVHDLLAYLRQEATAMALDVQVKTVDPQPIISITRRVKIDQLNSHIDHSLQTLFALAESAGGPVGPPLGIYHGPVNQDDDGPMEVCVPVGGKVTAPGDVVARELTGGTLASVTLGGDECEFPAILKGYDAVFDWVRQNGYEMLEAPREIWHSPPGTDARMEIALLFREAV